MTGLRRLCTRFSPFLRNIMMSTSRLIPEPLTPKPLGDFATKSAIRRVLATSTDPDKIASAAALILTITWSPDSDVALDCQRLRDAFVGCFEIDGHLRLSAEDRAIACGRALNYLCLTGMPIGGESNNWTVFQQPRIWHQWHSIILPRGFDQCKTLVCQLPTLTGQDKQKCHADAQTALRMMVAAAGDGFIHPDNESIVWRGQFTWSGDHRTATDFDWLIDYFVSSIEDHTLVGDALLVLSAMGGLGSHDRAPIYIEALLSTMQSDSPQRVRYAALRALSFSRMAIANINAIEDEKIRDTLPEKLSPALLMTICPDHRAAERHIENASEVALDYWRDDAYLQLIMTLVSNERWCRHLVIDRHIEHCISMLHNLDEGSLAPFRLAAIFGRVCATCPDVAVFEAVADTKVSSIAKIAWQSVLDLHLYDEDECMDALPAVVDFTVRRIIPTADLKDICRNVGLIMNKLKRRNKRPEIMSVMQDYYTAVTRFSET